MAKKVSRRNYRRKHRRWTKKRVKLAAEILAIVALFAAAVFALQSTGELEAVLGLPEKTPAPTMAPGQAELDVYFLDVGQADCTLIRIPEEDGGVYTVLVDAGDQGDEKALLKKLAALGVRRIDAAVFTHPHADHIGGAAEVLLAIPCTDIYMPPVPTEKIPTTASYEDLLDTMLQQELPYMEAAAGTVIYKTENAALTVLSPQRGDAWEDLNSWSVVLRLEYGETVFLFTGDAEADCERKMLQSGQNVNCDVLKVGHHGSDSSSGTAFLSACSPRYAVISCGKNNDYGHPSESVLQTLAWMGIEVHRTDTDGTLHARSDGTAVTLAPAA